MEIISHYLVEEVEEVVDAEVALQHRPAGVEVESGITVAPPRHQYHERYILITVPTGGGG